MSFAGFKKQLNKANQYMSEKIGGAEKTQYDEEFVEMERKIDVTALAVEEVISKTTEFLQPNPLTRAKMSTAHTMNKMRGQTKSSRYPQPEGNLGDTFLKFGRELGEESLFGNALTESGEAYKQLADVKDGLDFNVKQNFLDPLEHLKQKELKEIITHRKKMQGRRLDYDCKKRKVQKGGSQLPEEEIRIAEEKFEESRDIVENGMRAILESDVEQVRQLQALVEAQIEFHEQAKEILQQLTGSLSNRIMEGVNRPKTEFKSRKNVISTMSSNSYNSNGDSDEDGDGGISLISARPTGPSAGGAPATGAVVCKALYDFDPENEGELAFRDGDIIDLVTEIDENWLEGKINGVTGYFPRNYVEIQRL